MNSRVDLSEISTGRRRFLRRLSQGFLSLWGVGFLWVIASYLKPPKSRQGLADRVIHVGPLDALPVGAAHLVRHGREPVWVVRLDQENLFGLAAVCTHLHCVLEWDGEQRQLACPCHEGAFDMNGNVLLGPPPSALKRYRVETRLGEVYLHL